MPTVIMLSDDLRFVLTNTTSRVCIQLERQIGRGGTPVIMHKSEALQLAEALREHALRITPPNIPPNDKRDRLFPPEPYE